MGTEDRHIAAVDADDVALAAIQWLNEKVECGTTRAQLEIETAALRKALQEIKQLLTNLAAQEDQL